MTNSKDDKIFEQRISSFNKRIDRKTQPLSNLKLVEHMSFRIINPIESQKKNIFKNFVVINNKDLKDLNSFSICYKPHSNKDCSAINKKISSSTRRNIKFERLKFIGKIE